MPFGSRRGYSDYLTGRHIDNLRDAATFAHCVGFPLNLCVDINWDRTWLGDDPDGRVLDNLMELSRKWLKPRAGRFAYIEVRERPQEPTLRPNAHILVHCPVRLQPAFQAYIMEQLTRVCGGLSDKAVDFRRIGNGNATLRAALGRIDYLSKGLEQVEGERRGIHVRPQGRVHGKRSGVSQDIGPAARRRYARTVSAVEPTQSDGPVARVAARVAEVLQGATLGGATHG